MAAIGTAWADGAWVVGAWAEGAWSIAVDLFPPNIIDAPPRRWKVDAEVKAPAEDAPERNLTTDDL